jgi:hypothetical protein
MTPQIELDAIAEALETWLRTAEELARLGAHVAGDRQPAVQETQKLLARVREGLPAWKGSDHVH